MNLAIAGHLHGLCNIAFQQELVNRIITGGVCLYRPIVIVLRHIQFRHCTRLSQVSCVHRSKVTPGLAEISTHLERFMEGRSSLLSGVKDAGWYFFGAD